MSFPYEHAQAKNLPEILLYYKKKNEFIKVTQRQQNRESVVTDVRREAVADSQTKENPASMGE